MQRIAHWKQYKEMSLELLHKWRQADERVLPHKKQSINIHCVNHRVESGDQVKLFVQELWPPTIYTQRDGPAVTTPTALPYTYRPVIITPPSLSTQHSHPFPQETLISPPIGNSC